LPDFLSKPGFYDPSDDSIELRVDIQVQRSELYAYDSRKETGCVGLKNQGATCYMNSLVQCLFHLNYFRKVTMAPCLPGSGHEVCRLSHCFRWQL
jgi:ubiquitin carboxyl-terminal hydrolase 7